MKYLALFLLLASASSLAVTNESIIERKNQISDGFDDFCATITTSVDDKEACVEVAKAALQETFEIGVMYDEGEE